MSATNVTVIVDCPNCGAKDYEYEFVGAELDGGTQQLMSCDECDKRIAVDCMVTVQAVGR